MRALRQSMILLLWPLAATVAGASALAAVTAQWGRVSLEADLLAHFAPLWLLGAAAALAVSLAFRGWRRGVLVIGGLIGVAASAGALAPEFLRSVGPQAPPN